MTLLLIGIVLGSLIVLGGIKYKVSVARLKQKEINDKVDMSREAFSKALEDKFDKMFIGNRASFAANMKAIPLSDIPKMHLIGFNDVDPHKEYLDSIPDCKANIDIMGDSSLSDYLEICLDMEYYELAAYIVEVAKKRGVEL
jgi:hypothetical protein